MKHCFALLLLLLSFCAVSQERQNDPVPQVVKAALSKQFPGIRGESWLIEENPPLYIAAFNLYVHQADPDPHADGYTTVSFYRSGEKDGKWFRTVRNYLEKANYEKEIPEAVLVKIKEKIIRH